MAAIILSRGALSFCAKDVYHKLDNAQEQLFAYFYHLDKGDEQSANKAFSEYIRLGDIAIQAKRELMKKTRRMGGLEREKKMTSCLVMFFVVLFAVLGVTVTVMGLIEFITDVLDSRW